MPESMTECTACGNSKPCAKVAYPPPGWPPDLPGFEFPLCSDCFHTGDPLVRIAIRHGTYAKAVEAVEGATYL